MLYLKDKNVTRFNDSRKLTFDDLYVYRGEDVLETCENNGERRLSSRTRSKRRRILISETR